VPIGSATLRIGAAAVATYLIAIHGHARVLLQDVQLMSQDQDFNFQPLRRLEAVTEHTEEQEADSRWPASQMDEVFGRGTLGLPINSLC